MDSLVNLKMYQERCGVWCTGHYSTTYCTKLLNHLLLQRGNVHAIVTHSASYTIQNIYSIDFLPLVLNEWQGDWWCYGVFESQGVHKLSYHFCSTHALIDLWFHIIHTNSFAISKVTTMARILFWMLLLEHVGIISSSAFLGFLMDLQYIPLST